jgi:hypothetical protein
VKGRPKKERRDKVYPYTTRLRPDQLELLKKKKKASCWIRDAIDDKNKKDNGDQK